MKRCCRCKFSENEIDFGANKSICKACLRERWSKKYSRNCLTCSNLFSRRGSSFCSLKCTILGKVQKIERGCWLWKGAVSGDGYGAIKEINSRTQVGVHRKSYEEFKGKIPVGTFVCHSCDNPLCCNPDHLFLGTPKDNTVDSVKKGRSRSCHQHGSKNSMAKLDENIVQKIKELFTIGWQVADIHDLTGIPMGTLEDIKYNKTWQHVQV
jgi:hypothetical protein